MPTIEEGLQALELLKNLLLDLQKQQGGKGGKKGKKGKKQDKAAEAPSNASGFTDKQVKAAIKEGGKKGQDLAGLFDMGGISFFHVAMEKCEGNVDLLTMCMDGANKKVEDGAEERKGGADNLGKFFFSADVEQLAMVLNVPECQKGKMDINEWFERCTSTMGPVEVIEKTDIMIKAVAKKNEELEKFPLKMRDEAIGLGFAFLREKGLVPEDDSDSDLDGDAFADAGIEW
jgi:lipoate-protein ligase A